MVRTASLVIVMAAALLGFSATAGAVELDSDVAGVVERFSVQIDTLKADIARVTEQFTALGIDDASAEIARIDGVLTKLEGIGDYIAVDSPLVKSVARWQSSLKRQLENLDDARAAYGDEFVGAARRKAQDQLQASAEYLKQLEVLHARVVKIAADLRRNRNGLSLLLKLDKSQEALGGLGKLIQDLNATVGEIERLAPRFSGAGT